MKKQPGWLRPVAIALASIFGCVALSNGFGFLLKRPDAVPMFSAMFLFIAGMFALMVRIARPPKIAIEKHPARSPMLFLPIFAAATIASVVRGTLQHWWHVSQWIEVPAYLLTFTMFMILFNKRARRIQERRAARPRP